MPNDRNDTHSGSNREKASSDVIRLTLADQTRFVEALLDPTPANPALVRAFEYHRRLISPS